MFISLCCVGYSPARTTMTIISYNCYHTSHPFLWVMRSSTLSSTTPTVNFLPHQRPANVLIFMVFHSVPSPCIKKQGFIFYQKQLSPQFHRKERIHLALAKIIFKTIPKSHLHNYCPIQKQNLVL